MEIKEILFKLTEACGVSGNEGNVADTAKELLGKYMQTRVDNAGSVIGEKNGAGRHILLDAHIDEIGLIVTSVDEKGFLRVASVGGADKRVLHGAPVTVWGREPVNAVVCSTPPHLADDESNADKDIIIDTGLGGKRASELIKPGDTVTHKNGFRELLDGRVTAKSLDDRAGMAVILRAVELICESGSNARLTVQFSVQEEVGTRGAGAGAFVAVPDEAIAVDVSFAGAPDVPSGKSGAMDGGAMIGVSPVLDRTMSEKLFCIAEKNSLKHQAEVMNGKTGTNADAISLTGAGIPTALVSVPLRNMHTAAEIVSLNDIESCARLIAIYVAENGGEK